jgi:hypothetical protein
MAICDNDSEFGASDVYADKIWGVFVYLGHGCGQ